MTKEQTSVGGGYFCDCRTRDIDETCLAGTECRATKEYLEGSALVAHIAASQAAAARIVVGVKT